MNKRWLPALLLCAGMAMGACSGNAGTDDANKDNVPAETTDDANKEETAAADPKAKSEGVMTYQEYVDAPLDSEVTVEGFVQGKQAWWEDKATLYLADGDGAYFVYNANVPEDLYAKLTDGTKVKVKGYKTEWSGETEIGEGAEVEVVEDGGTWMAEPTDVTALLADEDALIAHQNQLVSFEGMTVEPAAEGSEEAYLYNYDGSGEDGDDLYFNVSKDGNTYTFTVESYLTDKDSDVYKAVKDLKVGDTVDLEGFLYWYEGANPHITSVTVVE